MSAISTENINRNVSQLFFSLFIFVAIRLSLSLSFYCMNVVIWRSMDFITYTFHCQFANLSVDGE